MRSRPQHHCARLSWVCFGVLAVLLAQPVALAGAPPQVNVAELLDELPQGERWIRHLKDDLLPFWEMKTALGNPEGNYPTYRCNDGSLYNSQKPCPELTYAVDGIVWLDREYVRAKSRQAFAYGIAYHLTGEAKYLRYAKAGVDFLRQNALDPQGGAVIYWRKDQSGLEREQRTSQDLAYALTGMGFYYYLTHDPKVLDDIMKLMDYIWDTYYDKGWDMLKWVKKSSPDDDQPNQKELVAQLDQVYGYMLWLTPALSDPYKKKWEERLTQLARIMITQFYTVQHNLFWGAVTGTETRQLEQTHVDFGHSGKTLWLIYQIGKLTKHLDLILFGATHAARILEEAYLPETGSWARRPLRDESLDMDKEWWILAELDQLAATLALTDLSFARYLPKTYAYWFAYMVDKQHGGVWHMVDGKTNRPFACTAEDHAACFPKQHSWKNALHTFEHALVGYITAQQLHGKPVKLYYAFMEQPDQSTIHPYFYLGKVQNMRAVADEGRATFKTYEVSFTDIR